MALLLRFIVAVTKRQTVETMYSASSSEFPCTTDGWGTSYVHGDRSRMCTYNLILMCDKINYSTQEINRNLLNKFDTGYSGHLTSFTESEKITGGDVSYN